MELLKNLDGEKIYGLTTELKGLFLYKEANLVFFTILPTNKAPTSI